MIIKINDALANFINTDYPEFEDIYYDEGSGFYINATKENCVNLNVDGNNNLILILAHGKHGGFSIDHTVTIKTTFFESPFENTENHKYSAIHVASANMAYNDKIRFIRVRDTDKYEFLVDVLRSRLEMLLKLFNIEDNEIPKYRDFNLFQLKNSMVDILIDFEVSDYRLSIYNNIDKKYIETSFKYFNEATVIEIVTKVFNSLCFLNEERKNNDR